MEIKIDDKEEIDLTMSDDYRMMNMMFTQPAYNQTSLEPGFKTYKFFYSNQTSFDESMESTDSDASSRKSLTFSFKDPDRDMEREEVMHPPDLKSAKIHWECSGIGLELDHQISSGKDSFGLQAQVDSVSTCQCCLNTQKKPFPIFTNPFKIKQGGATLKIYLLFNLCCLALLATAFIGFFQMGYSTRASYCKNRTSNSYFDVGGCSLFDIDSYILMHKVHVNDPESINRITDLEGVQSVSTAILVMYVLIFCFSYAKVQLLFSIEKQPVEHPSVSDFTILVEGVDGVGEHSVDLALDYINQLMAISGDEKLEIVDFLLAKPSGMIERAKNFLKREKRLSRQFSKRISNFFSVTRLEGKHLEKAEKRFKKVENQYRQGVQYFSQRVSKLNEDEIMTSYKDRWSILFITFQTELQKQRLLSLYHKKNSSVFSAFIPFSSYFRKTNKYRISPAPEPKDINWEKLGHSVSQYRSTAWKIRFVMALTVPIFYAAFFLSSFVFIYLKHSFEFLRTGLT